MLQFDHRFALAYNGPDRASPLQMSIPALARDIFSPQAMILPAYKAALSGTQKSPYYGDHIIPHPRGGRNSKIAVPTPAVFTPTTPQSLRCNPNSAASRPLPPTARKLNISPQIASPSEKEHSTEKLKNIIFKHRPLLVAPHRDAYLAPRPRLGGIQTIRPRPATPSIFVIPCSILDIPFPQSSNSLIV